MKRRHFLKGAAGIVSAALPLMRPAIARTRPPERYALCRSQTHGKYDPVFQSGPVERSTTTWSGTTSMGSTPVRAETADGRGSHRLGQWIDLAVQTARRPPLPRRRTGQGGRLRRVDRALGEARPIWPEDALADGLHESPRRQDLRDQADQAVSVARLLAGPGLPHDAGTDGAHRCFCADHRVHRQRTIQVHQGRVCLGLSPGLREIRQVCTAQRAPRLPQRRQGGER